MKNTKSLVGKDTGGLPYFVELTPHEFQKELMGESDLTRITASLFDKMLKDDDNVHELAGLLAFHLSEKYKINYDFEELKACVAFVDKTLFISFRDAKITLD